MIMVLSKFGKGRGGGVPLFVPYRFFKSTAVGKNSKKKHVGLLFALYNS
jgi:hypothetical protein